MGPNDLLNSAIAGFGSGVLGGLQGGQLGVLCYSIIFAIVGTTVDYATLRLTPILRNLRELPKNGSWLKLPDWSSIQVLDEEELAEKQAPFKYLMRNNLLKNKLENKNSKHDEHLVN